MAGNLDSIVEEKVMKKDTVVLDKPKSFQYRSANVFSPMHEPLKLLRSSENDIIKSRRRLLQSISLEEAKEERKESLPQLNSSRHASDCSSDVSVKASIENFGHRKRSNLKKKAYQMRRRSNSVNDVEI